MGVGTGLLLVSTACWEDCNCGEGKGSSGQAPVPTLQVVPPSAVGVVGQITPTRFSARTPDGSPALWTVVPSTLGTIDATGAFRDAGVLGSCQVVATWQVDPRVTGFANVTIIAAPQPATLRSDLIEADGGHQTASGGTVRNHAVAGEDVPAAVRAPVQRFPPALDLLIPPASRHGPILPARNFRPRTGPKPGEWLGCSAAAP